MQTLYRLIRLVITAHSGSVNRWPPMTWANGNSSLRTENSVFLAPESPLYLLCVIFSLLHFFGRRPKGRGAWPKWPNGKYVCAWTQLGDFCPADALAPPILDNSWSTSCETPPLWSPGYAYGTTDPNLHPLKALVCGSPDTLGQCEVTLCWILLVVLFAQNNVMNFSSKRHQRRQNYCLNKPYFYVKNAPNTQ